MEFKYELATVGGTFDRLHKGHAAILQHAFGVAKKLYIALTTDEFAKQKSPIILPYDLRKKELEDYLEVNGYDGRYYIKPLDTFYGGAPTSQELEAIIVTKDTKGNAIKINELRKQNKLKPLQIEVVPLEKVGKHVISSTLIRDGVMDRRGNEYLDLFLQKKLMLPEGLRDDLRKPLGEVFPDTRSLVEYLKKQKGHIIAVGDVVSQELKNAGIQPTLSVIDLKTQRQQIDSAYKGKKYANDPGTIRSDAVVKLRSQILDLRSQTSELVIDGEEDLLTLPAVLLATLGSVVVYGQRELGAIAVQVTEEVKRKVQDIISQFVS